jgi:bifunctional non-homologous end joining protein LigD
MSDPVFVVQEHHARRLHWDFRLERDGVLVSWALPKGVPANPATNHLAVHTPDHPMDFGSFEGAIGEGEYGAGRVIIWDRGTYVCEKWTDDEVKVVLSGGRVSGRYVLFRTGGDDWMIHRMDPPQDPDRQPMPDLVRPMLATAGTLPAGAAAGRYAYEMKWDGVRAVVYVSGGRARVMTRNDREVSRTYPELSRMADSLGSLEVVLDGEVVALDASGRPDFGLLQQRMHVTVPSQVRALVERVPVSYLAFDLLYLDGRLLLDLPYAERRALLDGLDLEGPRWGVPPAFPGDGDAALAASRAQRLEGVVAKRLDSRYEAGRRSSAWVKVKTFLTQEAVVGGWRPGTGRREGTIGSLLLGIPDGDGLAYIGHVGTGFTDAVLADLERRLRPLRRSTSPFAQELPRADARDAVWVTPRLVGEVAYGEWTRDGRLRHPSWRGLRPDKAPSEVVRE